MIHIKYKLDRSPIHGIGMFADQDVKRGDVVYSASPELDVNISDRELQKLDKKEQEEIMYWGFWDKDHNVWHVDFDNSRFINHAEEATVTQDEDHSDAYLTATRDINKGEEITQNYLEFETQDDLKKRGISL